MRAQLRASAWCGRRRKFLAACLPALLGACAAAGSGPVPAIASVRFYRPSGSVQCAPSRTTAARLAQLVDALSASGVDVVASACGNDGRAHIMKCGAASGDIWLVTVRAAAPGVMAAQGFRPASELTGAEEMPCLQHAPSPGPGGREGTWQR